MKEMFANSINEELLLWQSLIQNDGYKTLKKLIAWRKDKLLKDVLINMRQKKLDEAQESRSAYDELNKLSELISNRIELLKKESEMEEE